MEIMLYITKIIIYFVFVFLLFFSVSNKKIRDEGTEKSKIKISTIIFFCILFGLYSLICGQYPYSSDRGNFAFRFQNDIYLPYVKTESFGLYILEILLHLISHDPKILFFFVAFIYIFLTLVSYNKIRNVNPFALLVLGLSAYLSYGFYMLKQCLAIGFIALSFAEYSNKHFKRCIMYVAIAILFHESAWIIIPIYLALSFTKNNLLRIILYTFLIVIVLFFDRINSVIISTFSTVIPSLSSQISIYLDSNGSLRENINIMTALKGFPFYFIFTFGLIKRNQLKDKIKMYDKYMFLTLFVSVSTILSIFMYWMFRFATYFYFPVFVFASLILQELESKKDKTLFVVGLITMFFILTARMWYQYYFWYGGV